MKAIRIGEFGSAPRLCLEEVPPPSPGPNEAVISVKAAGVNPVDTYILTGTHVVRPLLPYTPGFDAAGIVARAGPGIVDLKVGQRVYVSVLGMGTYAEECLAPSESVHPLPDHVSFEEGAALGIPYVTAYRALFQLVKVRPGETLLIHGASGGVGVAAAQLARARGLRVIGSASTESGRQLVLQYGAHHALDHAGAAGWRERILELTDGAGPDVVLEMLANRNLAADIGIVAKGGRIVVVGNRGLAEVNLREAMAKDATIVSMMVFNATSNDLLEAHSAIRSGLENETLRPVVRQTFSLSRTQEALKAVLTQASGAVGKIVLLP